MMNSLPTRKGIYRTVLVFVAVALAGSAAVISRARTQTSSLTVTNSTNREIKHLYLSAPNSDNWGPDLLSDNVIPPGGSSTVGISCEQSSTKVIAEDQNGCFVSAVVSCGDNASWTITNNLTPDCGG